MTAISHSSVLPARRVVATLAAIAVAATASVGGRAAEFATLAPYDRPLPARIDARDVEGAALAVEADPKQVVLVHFFASWCEPCENELPALTAYLRDSVGHVRLVGVAVGEPASRAKRFADRFALPGPVANDQDKAIAGAFGVRGLPATVMIAPGGAKAIVATGEVDWASPPTRAAIAELQQ